MIHDHPTRLTQSPVSVARAAAGNPNDEVEMLRILRQRQVCERVGYSQMHIWRLEKAGRFPRRMKLGPNSVGWVSTEIDAWIEARIAERDARQQAKPADPALDERGIGRD